MIAKFYITEINYKKSSKEFRKLTENKNGMTGVIFNMTPKYVEEKYIKC